MSSLSLSSIFNQNKPNNDNKRSSTHFQKKYSTFSKVSKRFSSILKTKPTHRKVDSIFPSTIDTTTSLVPADEDSEDDDDDTLITPTSSNTALSQSIMIMDEAALSLTAPIDIMPTKLELASAIDLPSNKIQVDIVSVVDRVREELQRAFEDTDEEIERELAQSRYVMIQSIYAKPRFKYY